MKKVASRVGVNQGLVLANNDLDHGYCTYMMFNDPTFQLTKFQKNLRRGCWIIVNWKSYCHRKSDSDCYVSLNICGLDKNSLFLTKMKLHAPMHDWLSDNTPWQMFDWSLRLYTIHTYMCEILFFSLINQSINKRAMRPWNHSPENGLFKTLLFQRQWQYHQDKLSDKISSCSSQKCNLYSVN